MSDEADATKTRRSTGTAHGQRQPEPVTASEAGRRRGRAGARGRPGARPRALHAPPRSGPRRRLRRRGRRRRRRPQGLRRARPPTRSAARSATSSAPFPVRSVESVPDVPAEDWVVKVDGLVDTPLHHRPHRVDEPPANEGDGGLPLRRGLGRGRRALGRRGAVRPARAGRRQAGGEVRRLPRLRRRVPQHAAAGPRDATPKTMLADSLNGAPLPPKHGGPLRLVVPKQLGYKSVKWVERIELSDKIRTGYWEGNGYPEDGAGPREPEAARAGLRRTPVTLRRQDGPRGFGMPRRWAPSSAGGGERRPARYTGAARRSGGAPDRCDPARGGRG